MATDNFHEATKNPFSSCRELLVISSVADQVSLSRIPDLGSRIQNQQQKRGVKKIYCPTFFCSHKYHKIENYFIFEVAKKKIWANLQRIIELFVIKLSKI
jgi:hypothetical protein